MYNVLLFGLHSSLEEIERHLPSSICKQLVIQSTADLYSTAFSKIFDSWFIDTEHEEFKDISLEELITTQIVPAVFLIGNQKGDGGITRQPLPATDLNNSLFGKLNTLAKEIDSRVIPEHRWSSADICNIPGQIPKIDGLGPVGGFDKRKSEFILQDSLVDRALLLALLLNEA